MPSLFRVEGLVLPNGKRSFDLEVGAGHFLGVVSTAAGGASEFLQVLARQTKPEAGQVDLQGEPLIPVDSFPRKTTPASLMNRKDPTDQQERFAQTLIDLNLWGHRTAPISELPEDLQFVAKIVPPLSAANGILLLDGHLDSLDPWTLEGVFTSLQRFRSRGGAAVVHSSRPDILALADSLLVFRDSEPVFHGPLESLWRKVGAHTLEVATRNQAGIRALVEPFEVTVTELPDGLRLECSEGQEIAARLLRDGYGDVRYVISKRPSLSEAIRRLAT